MMDFPGNGPLHDIASSRKNSEKSNEQTRISSTFDDEGTKAGQAAGGEDKFNPAGYDEANDQTETDEFIGDVHGNNANGKMPDGDNDNRNKEIPGRDCRRYCRDFWASACTGICCCCPGESDQLEPNSDANSLDRKRRSVTCTDIPTLVIFLICVVVSVVVSILGIVKGNPLRLYYGYDSFGNTCGVGNGYGIFDNAKVADCALSGRDMTEKKYVFFMDASKPFSSMKLCVERCPNWPKDAKRINKCSQDMCGLEDYYNDNKVKLCSYNIDPKKYYKQKAGLTGPCPKSPVSSTSPVMHRCLPNTTLGQTGLSIFIQEIVGPINKYFQNLLRSVVGYLLGSVVGNSTPLILLFFSAVLMAFLIIVLIYVITSVIFWILLSMAAVGIVGVTSLIWYQYDQHKNGNATTLVMPITELEYASEKAFLIYGIVSTALTVVFFVLLAVTFNKIKVVINVFHRAGRILICSPFMLLVPVVTLLFLFAFCLIWSACFLSLFTAGDSRVDANGFVYRELNAAIRGAWWFYLFCFLWFSQFILDCENVVVSGVIVNNFFRRDDRCIVFPLTRSVCTLLRHHVGSVAFGSLFITLWHIPKYLLRIVKVPFQINRNGYAMVTIERSCFFHAANNAEALLIRNSLQVKAINSLGDFVLVVGKVVVTCCTTIAGFYWFKCQPEISTADYGAYFVIPVFLTAVFSYFVAHSFMTVYESAVDALLLCYCMDVDTSVADPIIEDAVKELDGIDEEKKKRGSLIARVTGGRMGKKGDGEGEQMRMTQVQEEEDEKQRSPTPEEGKLEAIQQKAERGFQVVTVQKIDSTAIA